MKGWLGLVIGMGLGLSGCVATSVPAAPAPAPAPDARPWLGISMGKIGGRGVLVKQVFRASPAEAAGILKGDVVVRVGPASVNHPGDVSRELFQKTLGDVVEVTLDRQGQERVVRATLEAFPGGEEVLRRERVGAAAPELKGLVAVQGDPPLTLAALRGKVAVIDFWAAWCVVCRKTVPTLNRWHEQLGPRGLVVVGLSSDELPQATRGVAQFGIRYPVAIDDTEEMFPAYGAMALPTLYVIDKKGVVRAVEVGFGPMYMARVERLLIELLDE